MNDGVLVEVVDCRHAPEFFFGRDADVAECRAGHFGEEALDQVEPRAGLGVTRDNEYKRCGTVSLLAEIDLMSGQVHALVRDRHRSREFIEFLKRCGLSAREPRSS
jgi:hypothetical protein